MDLKKALLRAASILALTAPAGHAAEAATVADPSAEASTLSTESDLLFELLARTQGSLTGEAIEAALTEMFANLSSEGVEQIPGLYANIVNLGATSEVTARLREVLIGLVSASAIEEALRDSVIQQLDETAIPITLAASQKPLCSTDPSSPNYDPNCPPYPGSPGTPGSLGGAGGGGGGGGGAGT